MSSIPKHPNGLPAIYHEVTRWAWNNWKREWVAIYGEPKPREKQGQMIGCEPPAWYKVADMEKFLAALPSSVDPIEIVADFVMWGCPLERFKFDGVYWCIAAGVRAKMDKLTEVK